MSTGLETRGDDGTDAGILQHRRLVRCRRRANRGDVFCPALVQDLPWRNSADKAEYRYVRVQQHTDLIFKSGWRIRFVSGTGCPQLGEMDGKGRETSVECAFVRCPGPFAF